MLKSDVLYGYKCDNYEILKKLYNYLLYNGYERKQYSNPIDMYKDIIFYAIYLIIYKDNKIQIATLSGNVDFKVIDARNKIRQIKLNKINDGKGY